MAPAFVPCIKMDLKMNITLLYFCSFRLNTKQMVLNEYFIIEFIMNTLLLNYFINLPTPMIFF